ncbi:MAG: DUF1800 family protein [Verrucomicrobiota bacterium]
MNLSPLFRSLVLLQLPLLLAALAPVARAQCVDVNSNGISDVWEALYSAQGCDPDADPDGDGVPNRLEAVAGTNPFDSKSLPLIDSIEVGSNGVHVLVSGAVGKRYELQSSESLETPDSWQAETALVARTNPLVVLDGPATLRNRFFRVVISDVDTAGSGMNDWEKYRLGLDPMNPYSNGRVDAGGKRLSDYQYAKQLLGGLTESAAPRKLSLPAASVAVYPSASATGTGLTGQYYTNASSVYTNSANFRPSSLFLTTNDAVIDFVWGPLTSPNLSNVVSCVRWTGQVEPQYSEVYTFQTRSDDGLKLWVNDQLLIDKWQPQGTATWANSIQLQAGVRYNIRLEYFNAGGSANARLQWYSPSQPRQDIPSERLYPSSGGLAPGGVTSPLNALGFVGQPFSYTITGANSPTGYDAANLPAGLGVNPTNGLVSGVPLSGGVFPVDLSVTNSIGVATAQLQLQIIDTGSAVTREVWLNVPGTSVTNIPLYAPATLTNTLSVLEGTTNFGRNYGERVRGYLTAPATGNYYFWIAASSSAELWISNDSEPANSVRRAVVTAPTAYHQWNLQPSQRSPWLALQAGQRYYIEILHKAGSAAGDHWSVGWLLDSTGTNRQPASVVPGYVLWPFTNTPPAQVPGTLFSANLAAESGVPTTGSGSATLRLSADGTQAILRFSYSSLSSPITSQLILNDPYKSHPSEIIYDIDEFSPQDDGSYVWNIVPVGTLSAADIVEIIREGKAHIDLHTVNAPAGEISGHFALAEGTAQFVPPPPPPAWLDDHSSSNAAARFLSQATFGPSAAEIKNVRSQGYAGWIAKQFKLPVSGHLTNVIALAGGDLGSAYNSSYTFNTWWQQSVSAPDQLRQRVAFALSEILVVSENGVLGQNAPALSAYYDILLNDAFGNFRTLLRDVTLSPAMGLYLDMRGNDKGNPASGTHPNENYAREIQQLFSIGLNRLWPDGSLVLNSQGDLVPTYDQNVVSGFARVFTGWNYHQTNQANKRLPTNWYPPSDYIHPMVLVPTHHELGTKLLLDNIVLPAAQGAQANSTTTNFDQYCSADFEAALDTIINNQNVGPFICRQLIQRLVTSHPSRDYVYRVTQAFNNNGKGVRGDLQAVIKAILLDYEARSSTAAVQTLFGKQREPLLRATALARAFPAPAPLKASYKQSGSPWIFVTTSKPHRLSASDDVLLNFTGKNTPTSQIYYNVNVSNANTFTVLAPGIASGTYNQSGNTITVTNSGHGLTAGCQLYLTFTSGGAPAGAFTVASVVSSSVFTVTAATSATRSGTCAFAKWANGSYVQSTNIIRIETPGNHALSVGQKVYVNLEPGSASSNGVYTVASVPGPDRFTVISPVAASWNGSVPLVLPLAPAPINRSGTLTVRYNTWNMGYTDGGSSSSLNQTPLNSPTVFNYFYPDFKFPGILTAAGLTTPEFQLTSDTTAVLQMNFITQAILNTSGNTNGLVSFANGSGAIRLDFSPWMTPAWTSDAGIPGLVEALNTLLCAGQLSPAAKTIIVSTLSNHAAFPYTTGTATEMRDRVRGAVHFIVSSPDFIIQR